MIKYSEKKIQYCDLVINGGTIKVEIIDSQMATINTENIKGITFCSKRAINSFIRELKELKELIE